MDLQEVTSKAPNRGMASFSELFSAQAHNFLLPTSVYLYLSSWRIYILVKLELIDFLFCTCLNQFKCKTNIREQLGYNNFLNDVL